MRQSSYGVISKEAAESEIKAFDYQYGLVQEIFVRPSTNNTVSVCPVVRKTQHYTSLNFQSEVGTELNNKYSKFGCLQNHSHTSGGFADYGKYRGHAEE
ncbi:MAG: hypothetical protein ACLU4N_06845 [Butyricimonas faecihominis]